MTQIETMDAPEKKPKCPKCEGKRGQEGIFLFGPQQGRWGWSRCKRCDGTGTVAYDNELC